MNNITELIERAEQCHQEVALEYFDAFSGRKAELSIVPILKRYPELYSRETYDSVAALTPTLLADERQRQRLLQVFTQNQFSDRLKELGERLANAEAGAVVKLDDEEYPYRSAPVVQANEQDYDRRGRLSKAYLNELDKLNPLREEAKQAEQALTGELNYRNMIDLCEQVKGMRIYPLKELTGQLLAETAEVYAERLERFAQQTAGLAREQLRHADIGFLMRARGYDDYFPPDQMVPALERTLHGLGIDLTKQGNVTLDLESRPKKSPRAFCIGIKAPQDVRLVLTPRGGQDDYTTLFHEAGHLQFSAHMSPELSYLYRQHGDTSVHESYAFLLQYLVDDPVWWREIMKTRPEGYFDFARFNKLYFLRRYSAKLHYEVEFYEQGGGAAMADTYANWLQRGTGVAYPPVRYLDDFDGGFYVVEYLQAWIWEVQLRDHLRREFGEVWFTGRKAGDFLKELWREGMKYDVWEIAGRLGFDGLSIEPLKAELIG